MTKRYIKMSITKKIILSSLLITIFSLMSLVIYKVDKNRAEVIHDCEITRLEHEQNLRVLDSLVNEVKLQEQIINLKNKEVEKVKKEITELREEKQFLTTLPKESDIKKIKFNR